MKLRVEVDGEIYTLHTENNNYWLEGAETIHGTASILEVRPGVFSVLLEQKSFTVYLTEKENSLEVLTAGSRRLIAVSDPRDRATSNKKAAAAGPVEIRAQMPGKVIKLLVSDGASVQAGDGVIVVEAMKMQNEMKSPKAGVVSRIRVTEGAAVQAGETIMVVE